MYIMIGGMSIRLAYFVSSPRGISRCQSNEFTPKVTVEFHWRRSHSSSNDRLMWKRQVYVIMFFPKFIAIFGTMRFVVTLDVYFDRAKKHRTHPHSCLAAYVHGLVINVEASIKIFSFQVLFCCYQA